MRCDEVRSLLDPLVDRELPDNEASAITAHIDDCPDCRRELDELTVLHERLGAVPRSEPPEGLQDSIMKAIEEVSTARLAASAWRWLRPLSTHVAAALLGGILVYGVALLSLETPPQAQEVLTAHLRSLMDERLTQVESGDPHKVKPWFAGKLDYAPLVIDLAAEGFPLTGGRIDYLDEQKIAALVYLRRAHKINLFILPEAGTVALPAKAETIKGYNLVEWRGRGFRFWAVSDLSAAELLTFSEAIAAAIS